MKRLLPILFLAAAANAETLVLTNRDAQAVNIPAGSRVVDMSGTRATRSDDAADVLRLYTQPSRYPAVLDTASGATVCDSLDVADMLTRLPAAIDAATAAKRKAVIDAEWPLLDAHPATNDIPASGMTYRIAEDGGLVTWWIARQGDLLATQLSAHDASGNEVTRTVDLKTGTMTEINLRALTQASKWSDLAGAKKTSMAKQKGRR